MIKAKAWYKEKQCWVSISPQTGYQLDLNNGQIYYDGLNVTSRFRLLLSTGLKDKEGKDIFEGDIVLEELLGFGHIKYIHNQFVFVKNNSYYSDFRNGIMKVIGNIYDDPNLTEEAIMAEL